MISHSNGTERLVNAAVLAEPPEQRGLGRENLLLGGHIREEDSPGNYVIRERDGRAEFVVFDYVGAEQVHISLPIEKPARP